jgi:transposase
MTTAMRKQLLSQGPASLGRQIPEILENADAKLSTAMRRLLDFLWQEWKGLQLQIESRNSELEQIAGSDPSCGRLQQIPGVGPLVSTAVVSAIGNGAAFGASQPVFPRNLWNMLRFLSCSRGSRTHRSKKKSLAQNQPV